MRQLLPALVLVMLAVSAGAQPAGQRGKPTKVLFMDDEDPAMKRAFEKARATLDGFLAAAKSPPAGTTAYAMKVGVRQGRDVEYFWVGNLRQTETGFSGTINSHPQMVKTVRLGQEYLFGRHEIVDWTYIDRNERRVVGNFTLCALLTKDPPEQAEATRKKFGLRCD